MVETRCMKKPKRCQWPRHNLPSDICREILTRLPAKSLLRFRSVSKIWRDLINDREFALSHLTNAIENRSESLIHVIQQPTTHRPTECVVRCNKTYQVMANHGSLDMDRFKRQQPGRSCRRGSQPEPRDWRVVGSVGGLFMLAPFSEYAHNTCNKNDLRLWNPYLGKARTLPRPPQTSPSARTRVIDVGLGFDPSTKDYKHVRFLLNGYSRRSVLGSVLVYTLGTNSWKVKAFGDKGCPSWRWFFRYNQWQLSAVFLHGAPYFLALHGYKNVGIVSYDLSNYEATPSNMPMAEGLSIVYTCHTSWNLALAKDDSSLALVHLQSSSEGSIWLSEGFGADLAWSKCYSLAPTIDSRLVGAELRQQVLYFDAIHGLMLLGGEVYSTLVTSHDLKTHEEKVVVAWENADFYTLRACPYVESLMLLT